MKSTTHGRDWRGDFIDSGKVNSMKTRIGIFPALALVAMAAAFVAIKAHAMTNPTPTPRAAQLETVPELVTLNFGSFGIVQGQVARISLVSLRRLGEATPPQPDRAELMFLGEDGRVLATRRVTIGAGQSASLELSMRDLGVTSTRLQLRAKVRFTNPPNPDSDPPSPDADPPQPDRFAIATVEVIELSGKTSLMLPYFVRGSDPPSPDLGE